MDEEPDDISPEQEDQDSQSDAELKAEDKDRIQDNIGNGGDHITKESDLHMTLSAEHAAEAVV